MANTRPLRYGGVMNSGFPTPPPGVFDDEPPGWTNNAAAPSAASTHAVKPEPYSPPRMATPTAYGNPHCARYERNPHPT